MLMNILYGSATMVVCLFMQALLLATTHRYYTRHENLLNSPSFWSSVAVIKVVMLLLLLGNMGQIAIWALLFQLLGEFQQFSDAFYHSAVNFATLGYGDIVMSADHKLLGPLEAVNGVLMIGVSTAVLMSAIQDAMNRTMLARKDR